MRAQTEPKGPQPHEPPLSPTVAARRKGLRTGWTTGTCASAAAKAAALSLESGRPPKTVEVALPAGTRASFEVETEHPDRFVVVKDAGDDPDCTHGARITAEVRFAQAPATELVGGPGIGTVTLPGLGLAVGTPAINPVPRRMILQAISEVTDEPLVVTFSVPRGEEMAEETTNARLGIVGGISLLGTTGIVRPFSTSAYRASVVQQVDVAGAQGHRTMVLATGHRSERAAMQILPQLPEVCFVEVGDFTGIALRKARGAGMRKVVFVGMAGKISKLAAGVMMTHYHRSEIDGVLLSEAARSTGAHPAVIEAATATSTARHFFETCLEYGCTEPLEQLCAPRGRRASLMWMALWT